MSRLDCINGVALSDIIERIRPFISYENEMAFQHMFCYSNYSVYNPDLLRLIGVIGEDNRIVLSLTDTDGRGYEHEIAPVSWNDLNEADYVRYDSGT